VGNFPTSFNIGPDRRDSLVIDIRNCRRRPIRPFRLLPQQLGDDLALLFGGPMPPRPP